MNGNAIQRVSQALGDLIQNAFTNANVPGSVFVGPLDDNANANAAAVLFLYRVALNPDLRNAEHRVPGPPKGPPTIHEGSLPLDLHYLLTGGSFQTGGELQALHWLGVAMQALNDSPNIVGLPVEGETVRVSVESITTEEMSRVWTLFPTANFRTSVSYLASPVWIDPLLIRPTGGPVLQETYRVGQKERELNA